MTVIIELPENLAQEAETAAKAAGETIDAFVRRAIAFEIERERTEAFFAERRARADVGKAIRILDRVGGEPPQPGDELPDGYVRSK